MPEVTYLEALKDGLAEEMAPNHDVWVATDPADGTRVVGFIALSAIDVDQLYIDPEFIGHGIGRRLLDLAKRERPDGQHAANWLPTPSGRMRLVLRAYEPEDSLIEGRYRAPGVQRNSPS